jgi:hypothetical protein
MQDALLKFRFSHPLRKLGLACVLASALMPAVRSEDAGDLAWPPITSETKPWAWWWWHGSAVDETNIAHELQRFHDAGLGGVQVTTIYGVKGAEARDIPYLTPRWLDMLGCTVDKAKGLDMGVTMSLGSGWCFGGPTVSDEDANAKVAVKTFDLKAGEKIGQKFPSESTQALVAFSSDGKATEITDKISADGGVDWTAPADVTIYAVSQKPSGQKVKRPAPGGEGWMLNPAYPQAMTNWLKWFDTAFANYSGSKPMAVFQDSYEYRTDWSPDFFAQFEKLRGYRLQTELPALFMDTAGITNAATLDHIGRVKYDYRRTLAEIMAQQSEPAWIDWAHKNGFKTIYQAHGTPGNWLDLYADADMPETEMFHNDRNILISKFASSAAHVAGRQFTGAETGTWMKEHFTETLGDMKALADDMFLSGVNRIFYHGTCYSPDDAPWPGWLFYASTEMNPRNPIWHDVPALNAYIARVQSVLQNGKPDNDVLLYWPVADFWNQPDGLVLPMTVSATDWFKSQPVGKAANELWSKGYSFDYVSDAQLQQTKVVDGKIQMPGGDYKLIVVPECKFMPLETFKQLINLAENGAMVVFENQLPTDVSGLGDLETRRNEFRKLSSQLKFDISDLGVPIATLGKGGKGCLLIGKPTDIWYARMSAKGEQMFGCGLFYIRRSFDGGWNYFIANKTATNFDTWITLARSAKSAALLDPLTGNSGVAAQTDSGSIHLQLAAGQSIILRAFADKKAGVPMWTYWQTNGQPVEISGTWNVKFLEGGPVLPADSQITKPISWTTLADTNCQAFAGTAKYQIAFDAPSGSDGSSHFELNLGDVCQSARVRMNDKDYGTLITPPFRVVVDNLKPAGNILEVEVTSVAANRVRDLDRRGVNWKYFKDINVVNENYKPFNAADWPLTDCGLLGPVTLTPVSASN